MPVSIIGWGYSRPGRNKHLASNRGWGLLIEFQHWVWLLAANTLYIDTPLSDF